MNQIARYALWLTPDEPVSRSLQDVIEELAKKFSGPVFQPHVTVLGSLFGAEETMQKNTEQLAQQISAVETRITGFAGAPYYFRCFFAPVEVNDVLRQAIDQAKLIFAAKTTTDFLPHISLLYGQLDRETKKTIPALIGNDVPRAIPLTNLALVRMNVSVSAWTVVTEIPLAAP